MTSPAPDEVNVFHAKSDLDTSKVAQHHTLGPGANQSSPGAHKHDGRDSKLLLRGEFPSFPQSASLIPTQAEVDACIQALRFLGAGQ